MAGLTFLSAEDGFWYWFSYIQVAVGVVFTPLLLMRARPRRKVDPR